MYERSINEWSALKGIERLNAEEQGAKGRIKGIEGTKGGISEAAGFTRTRLRILTSFALIFHDSLFYWIKLFCYVMFYVLSNHKFSLFSCITHLSSHRMPNNSNDIQLLTPLLACKPNNRTVSVVSYNFFSCCPGSRFWA